MPFYRNMAAGVVFLAAVSSGFCQSSGSKDVARMSVAEAREAAKLADGGKKAFEFVEGALRSGRLEIIEVCWREAATDQMLRDAMKRMPDSALKDKLVSRFLRKPIGWPSASPFEWKGDLMREGCVRFIIPPVWRYLPWIPADYSVVSTREKRLDLADAFDTAAGIPIEMEPEEKPVWPPHLSANRPIVINTPSQRVWPPRPLADRPVIFNFNSPRGWPPLTLVDRPIILNTPSQHDAAAPVATVAEVRESWPFRGGWAPWACVAAAIAGIVGWLARRLRGRNG